MSGTRIAQPLRTRLVPALAALAVTLAHGSAEAVNLKAGQPVPDFTVTSPEGGTLSLRDYRGDVVLLVFWASWSPRCREELEFLKKMRGKRPAVRYLAINAESDGRLEENIARVRRVAAEWELPFDMGVDEGLKVWNLYGIAALPTSIIVAPDGKLLFVRASFNLEAPEAIENALVEALSAAAEGEVALGETPR